MIIIHEFVPVERYMVVIWVTSIQGWLFPLENNRWIFEDNIFIGIARLHFVHCEF